LRSFQRLGIALSASLLVLCGCGGNGASSTPEPPSALTYAVSTATYTIGVMIATNSPTTSGGPVTSYSVSPALPAGLSLSGSTGVISGTPTAVAATASYMVTASNAGGSTTAALSITVDAALSYNPSTAVYTVGTQIAPNSPTTNGPAVISYSVNPALPTGLSLAPDTGIISGTPAMVADTQSYTVTALNATGSATAVLSITVDDVSASVQDVPNMHQSITPLAPPGTEFQELNPDLTDDPAWLAGQAATTVVSPDGKTLLILTTGYNRFFNASDQEPAADSNEYVFVYDISTDKPIKKQVLQVENTFYGITFDPSGKAFYVPGNLVNPANSSVQDVVHVFTLQSDGGWQEDTSQQLALNHSSGNGLPVPANLVVPINSLVYVVPMPAGVAVSSDDQTLVVANYYNDSMTVFTGGLGQWSARKELDLRPGKSVSNPLPGIPGGEYPLWVAVTGTGSATRAFLLSVRDREIDVVNLRQTPLQVVARIPLKGQPNRMILNAAQTLLYVAEDESDTVDVIDISNNPQDLKNNTVVETIPVLTPELPADVAQYTGANTNSVTLSSDGTRLYVTEGNLNAVAVVQLTGTNPPSGDHLIGLIPTGWYPNSVSFSADGTWMYVVNGKSPTGANPAFCYSFGFPYHIPCFPANEYNPQLLKAGFQSFPVPNAGQLAALTAQVATNDRFANTESPADATVMSALRGPGGIKHVIFIIKENRTYDQVLGDLPVGGDSALTIWGSAYTPNQHQLAQNFVTLDHVLTTAEVSYDGWLWTTAARAPDVVEHQYLVAYAQRGLSLDSEGLNRSLDVAIPTVAARQAADPLVPNDPDLLAGQTDVAAPDGPNDEVNTGYLWNAALRAGLTVRNYGFFIDNTCYNEPTCQIPLVNDPASTSTVVSHPTNAALTPYTDPYFRGFDNDFPDYYRFTEWERDFDANYASGGLPALTLVRFMHDHTGNFGSAIDLVNTPDYQVADNDYAVGLLVQKIANSIYASSTLIFIIEDDAQDGGDHIDSHRCPAFVVGAFVKQGGVEIPTHYNTVDFLRTIEEVLGISQLNLNDALATPMADIFSATLPPSAPAGWTFTATPSCLLYNTQLPLPPEPPSCMAVQEKSRRSSGYWAKVTKGLNFNDADLVDGVQYNRILWKGLMRGKPYPVSLRATGPRQEREDPDDDQPARQKPPHKPTPGTN
jgi:DNA-binding beta-propeller fold protein YncE